MRRLHALKSTHWVMWSSPILLLILVFTLTASSGSTPLHQSAPPRTPRSHAITASSRAKATTTTTTTATTTTTSPVRTTARASSVKIVTKVIAVPAPSSTNVSPGVSSSSETASNVGRVASASAENASSGVLSGQLSSAFHVADLPLGGPGTWDVASSAPVRVTLACSGATIPVTSQFVIGAKEICQVSITATTPGSSLTWQLTPVR